MEIFHCFPIERYVTLKDTLHLMSEVVYRYTGGRCHCSYYGETDINLEVRSGEHIGISPLTLLKVTSSKESAILDHLLIRNNVPFFEEFTALAYGHHE